MTQYSHVRLGTWVAARCPSPSRDWRSRRIADDMLLAFLAQCVMANEGTWLADGE